MFLAVSDDGATDQSGLSSDWTEIYDVTSPVGTTSACALHYRIATGTSADAASYDNSVYASAVVFAFRSSTGTFDFTPASDVAWSGTTDRTPEPISNDSADNTAVIIAHVQDTNSNPALPSGFSSTGSNNFGSGSSSSSTTVGHEIGGLSTPTVAPGDFSGVSSSPYFLRCTTIILREGAATGIEGSASITEADDSASGAGTLAIEGATSVTEAGDTSSATGELSIEGAASVNEADDTVGGAGALAISGASAITEDDDSLSASGGPTANSGAASITEDDDTSSASATLAITGAASITESDDATTAAGALPIVGAGAIDEADDTIAAAGALPIVGALAVDEDGDSLASTGTAISTGAADITEDDDGLSATGALPVVGSLAATEDDDIASSEGVLPIIGSLAATEADDTLSAAGGIPSVEGSTSITEGDDLLSSTSTLDIGGAAGLLEEDDSVAALGVVSLPRMPFVGGTSVPISGFTSGTVSVDLTSLTGGIDDHPSEGDWIVVAYSVASNGSAGTLSIKDGEATEYDLIGSQLYSDDIRDANLRVAYKFAGSTPDTSVDVGPTGGATWGGTVAVMVWRGADPDTVLDVAAVTQSQTNSNSSLANPPAITPSTDGAVVIAVGAGATTTISTGYSSSDLSNFISQISDSTTYNSLVGIGSIEWATGDGSVNPAAFAGATTDTNSSWAAITFAIRPVPGITGAADITEAPDSAAGTGVIPITCTVSITEAGDSISSAATLLVAAYAALTETGDGVSSTAAVKIAASATITEVDDSAAASATLSLSADLSVTEAGDAASATATVDIAAAAAIIEVGDTADVTATLLIEANANITEAGDGLSATGSTQTTVMADADITEEGDTVSAAAALIIMADAAIIEGGDNLSAIIERVYAVVANRRIRFIAETPEARKIEFVTANLDERPIIFVEPSAPRIIEWVRV